MLIAVILAFLIFSFTGVAVLDVAYNSRSASLETTKNIKFQYAVESTINEALWLINTGADNMVNYTSDGVSCSWDSLNQVLTLNVSKYDLVSEVQLDLSNDTPFDHVLSSITPVETNGYSPELIDDVRQFDVLPTIDLDFFYDKAVKFHHGNDNSWKSNYLVQEGVHIFTGNNLSLDNISISNTTLVFTGKYITFTGTNSISSGTPVNENYVLPTLVFTNPDVVINIADGNQIEGAVYCAGKINIGSSSLTGPVIARTIALDGNMTIIESDHSAYYNWNLGFGTLGSYDWPKQIGRWSVNKWDKKTNA